MDIVVNGIHYINLSSFISEHLVKCHSEETIQTLQWLVAKEMPRSEEDIHKLIHEVLLALSKVEFNCQPLSLK
jgi:hypothetical protein